jgi:hypothetical protein
MEGHGVDVVYMATKLYPKKEAVRELLPGQPLEVLDEPRNYCMTEGFQLEMPEKTRALVE